ncbi:hypothetical protein J2Y45_005473 [Dyadobacter sp. BE34]|uniref:Lipocalin-like domain-containing protein n=1 Tax=Dyadobacter fermentans TaxID=94254 RepID=A0ABU1R4A2_9BACT|nr:MULTISPECIES: hypothetical protein [Dyadobacter]MDR6808178.1 hypothetical protein [Dyadobacter fermentans]MDR7046006.1 hypothetical protein [Dyadobacter sp. BE242]MDR7200319.1 hypothetical protein [Dyadobacter sp. BE34]MDR7218279.1 hypothetical protein [Dyadobacter sp. BE31]MDR7266210.1 hypothetical protein [Dyadobacter sp. BE32]
MRKLLFIAILLTSISCKKDSDPTPSNDLTRDLVGSYQYRYSEVYLGNITIEYTVKWIITKTADNKISLSHRETGQVIPTGPIQHTTEPLEITFNDIELTRKDGFTLDRTVDWRLDSREMEKVRVVFEGNLVGGKLDVKSKTAIVFRGDVSEDLVTFTKL